jgi:hypothetical protein
VASCAGLCSPPRVRGREELLSFRDVGMMPSARSRAAILSARTHTECTCQLSLPFF